MLMSGPAGDELSHERLMDYGQRLSLPGELLTAHTRFAASEYARNLVCRTPRFELLVLCWRPGQQSTIHDHGGSLNAIRVHRGELTSRLYAAQGAPPQAAGPARLWSSRRPAPATWPASAARASISSPTRLAATSSPCTCTRRP